MSCQNEVSYWVGEMPCCREVMVRCGTTDPHGDRCICEECENDSNKLRAHKNHVANVEADNAWARSSGYGEY